MRTSQTMTSGTNVPSEWREARSEQARRVAKRDRRYHRCPPAPGHSAPGERNRRSVGRDRPARRRSGPGRPRWRRRGGRARRPGSSAPARGRRRGAASPSAPPPRARSPRAGRASTTASRNPAPHAPSGSYILAPTVAIWSWRGESRSRASSTAQRGSTSPISVSIRPMRNAPLRADALVGAEQQQRAGRDRVPGARDDHRHLRPEQARDERAAVGHELARGLGARPHHRRGRSRPRASPARP